MGRKKNKHHRKHHVADKSYHRAKLTANRTKDIDQIQDEIKNFDPSKPREVDPDLPGLGQYYCLACALYCINRQALEDHCKSKRHKQRYFFIFKSHHFDLTLSPRVKIVSEPQYTQREAEQAAGFAEPV